MAEGRKDDGSDELGSLRPGVRGSPDPAEAGSPTGSGPLFRIREARFPEDSAEVRTLLLEYRRWLAEHREITAFDDSILTVGLKMFDAELEDLSRIYGPPEGAFLLGYSGSEPAGSAALRRIDPQTCELKRVYLRPSYRGLQLGKQLTQAALLRARRAGYSSLVLDTLPTMQEAIGMYRGMGFRPIPRYWDHPVPNALFFEYALDDERRSPR